MKIKDIKQQISRQLNHSTTPELDAELLISYCLQKPRSYLYAYPEQTLTSKQTTQLQQLQKRRQNGEPMAYILEQQEFWSLPLTVTPDVLIPRPETEHLVEWLLENLPPSTLNIAELGTGSGAIAIALGKERPTWKITATDISTAALKIAKQNITALNLTNISCYQGDFCDALPQKNYTAIVSNPPYLANNDSHLAVLQFEPWETALIAGQDGLDAINKIVMQASHHLLPNGHLILEHGYQQAKAVHHLLSQAGYTNIHHHQDLAGLPRFTTAIRA
ncbi:MAG: peptide chain release factor N(5)-glutamine methyltransferase [Gammaproteobacteria bacterium]|nr:peptide chain release factor N(5)-glutamine methyltransferase [Gammaproteobacteria bacterium]